jgi:S-adenosylmethionine decarboxylase proenzyme
MPDIKFSGGGTRVDLIQSKKLKLESFNNLTKTLSFNIYDICYAKTEAEQKEYIAYIDEAYNAERLTTILTEVSNIIGANILNIAHQDYEPEGASVTMLIAELPVSGLAQRGHALDPLPDAVVAHLDKSHITVHTAPFASTSTSPRVAKYHHCEPSIISLKASNPILSFPTTVFVASPGT